MHLDAEFWVAAAFVTFVAILWKVGAFRTLIQSLDHRSEQIARELDEARALREEARQVLEDYQRKRLEAEKEASEIVETAKSEAKRISLEAEEKLDEFVRRRTELAESRIKQAEEQAATDVRNAAAEAAVKAAEVILRSSMQQHGAEFVQKGLQEVKTHLN
jgi:F-type H+-transporting ATPase subunit b